MGLRTTLGLKKKKKKAAPPRKVRPRPPISLQLAEGWIEPPFPIDIVYTWVDGNDAAHRAKLEKYAPEEALENPNVAGAERFRDNDELRYSLRSIELFAPWVNHIYIVTDNQRPDWLADHPKATVVDHSEILDGQYLPLFNSSAIESALHHIPGLSEHYVFFNDDVMLLRPLSPAEVFTAGGAKFSFVSQSLIPEGAPSDGDNSFVWALKNTRDLCVATWGHCIPRRFQHIHRPMRRSVAERCEAMFPERYAALRRNRFRSREDFLPVSYLHCFAAYIFGEAVLVESEPWIVDTSRASAPRKYQDILGQRGAAEARMAACFNDTHMSQPELPDGDRRLSEFLRTYFPEPSQFEQKTAGREPLSNLSSAVSPMT